MLVGPPRPALASSPSQIYCSVTLASLLALRTAKLNTKSKPPSPLQSMFVGFFCFHDRKKNRNGINSEFFFLVSQKRKKRRKRLQQVQLNCSEIFKTSKVFKTSSLNNVDLYKDIVTEEWLLNDIFAYIEFNLHRLTLSDTKGQIPKKLSDIVSPAF